MDYDKWEPEQYEKMKRERGELFDEHPWFSIFLLVLMLLALIVASCFEQAEGEPVAAFCDYISMHQEVRR